MHAQQAVSHTLIAHILAQYFTVCAGLEPCKPADISSLMPSTGCPCANPQKHIHRDDGTILGCDA